MSSICASSKAKKSFLEAVPTVKFHQYSELRTTPFCQHFGTCGGCKWQHLGYDTQLHFKQQQVVDQLTRIGKVALPEIPFILSSPQRTYYRNKLEYTFSDNGWLTHRANQRRHPDLRPQRAGLPHPRPLR